MRVSASQEVLQDPPYESRPLARWFSPEGLSDLTGLFHLALMKKRHRFGDTIELCAILNARSGRCSEDCAFCAQSSRHKTRAPAYPLLTKDEMVDASRKAFEAGAVRFSIVTSGRDCPKGTDLDEICRAIEAIRREGNVAPCASLGMLTPQEARRLASAGLVRYHHNLEAAEDFFPCICSTHTYSERVETLLIAREAGLEICSGGILGMGETNDQRLRLAEALADLSPQSVPINFLHPAEGTRLEGLPPLGLLEALAAVAIFTLLIPNARIRVAGGRIRVMGGLSSLIYLAGAAGLMIGDYLTTKGREPSKDLEELEGLGLKRVSTPWEGFTSPS